MAKQKVALECLSYHATAGQEQTLKLVNEPIKSAVDYKLYSFKFVGNKAFPLQNWLLAWRVPIFIRRFRIGGRGNVPCDYKDVRRLQPHIAVPHSVRCRFRGRITATALISPNRRTLCAINKQQISYFPLRRCCVDGYWVWKRIIAPSSIIIGDMASTCVRRCLLWYLLAF